MIVAPTVLAQTESDMITLRVQIDTFDATRVGQLRAPIFVNQAAGLSEGRGGTPPPRSPSVLEAHSFPWNAPGHIAAGFLGISDGIVSYQGIQQMVSHDETRSFADSDFEYYERCHSPKTCAIVTEMAFWFSNTVPLLCWWGLGIRVTEQCSCILYTSPN